MLIYLMIAGCKMLASLNFSIFILNKALKPLTAGKNGRRVNMMDLPKAAFLLQEHSSRPGTKETSFHHRNIRLQTFRSLEFQMTKG